MLQPTKSGNNWKEKRRCKRNTLNNNNLQTLLITRIFATNFAIGCFDASFERHFVNIIQH